MNYYNHKITLSMSLANSENNSDQIIVRGQPAT